MEIFPQHLHSGSDEEIRSYFRIQVPATPIIPTTGRMWYWDCEFEAHLRLHREMVVFETQTNRVREREREEDHISLLNYLLISEGKDSDV